MHKNAVTLPGLGDAAKPPNMQTDFYFPACTEPHPPTSGVFVSSQKEQSQ